VEYDFKGFRVERRDQVATITLVPVEKILTPEDDIDSHWEIGELFARLRGDNSVRLVVVQGSDGDFHVPVPTARHADGKLAAKLTEPASSWLTFTGLIRFHETIASMEKPVIAKVTGDAIGFGSSLAFACDLIAANEKARFADHHMGLKDVSGAERGWSVVPGDGGLALVPTMMPPHLAKEYLMLGRVFTGRELADLGIINHAVPAEQLDDLVDDLVQRLLARSAHSLARTKRVANRSRVDHLNMTLDAGIGYELADMYQLVALNGSQPKKLR